MRRTAGVLLLATVLSIAPLAAAGHGGDPITVHKCYESGPPPGLVVSHPDPTGQTCDGTIDVGGVIAASPPVGHAVTGVQISVVDDVWASGAVGAFVCQDTNGDGICGGEGEPAESFCGDSGVLSATIEPVVFLHGPVQQAQDCDAQQAPTGATTGGVLGPSGGIFFTFL